ncbi:MAG: membrane dipeptidase, partial [Spirochaetales bacterium]|nr:membrane dipeptidase [Spirochaetales bacterium]
MGLTSEESKELLNNIFYFDVHGHIEKTLPPILRILSRSPIPKDIKLSELKKTGVNGFIICAIGDPNSFRKHKVDAFTSVKKQLTKIKRNIRKTGGIVARSAADLINAASENRPVFVLGIEGGDFIEDDPERLSFIYKEGVRVLAPVHYSKNMIGSIEFGWGGKTIPQEEQTGLTSFGKTIVKKANELGIIVDLAHADEKTLMDVVAVTETPVFCSHTGPRSLQNFPRYISDAAIKAVAGTG